MSYRMSHRRLGRNMFATAAAGAALIVGGCMSDQQQPGQRAYNPASNSSAVQASDTSQAPAPTDSRTAMAFPTGDRNTSALLVEESGPREVRVGQPYNYEIRVTNLTNQPLNGVVLTQRIPANFRLNSGATDTAASDVNRTQRPE